MSFCHWNFLINLLWCCLISDVFVTSIRPESQSVSCNSYKTCSQKCDTIGGNPKCSCVDGYRLKNDTKTCSPIDPDWTLFFTTKSIIYSLSGSGDSFTNLKGPKNIMKNEASSLRFITCDVRSNTIYWSDASNKHKGVYKMGLEDSSISYYVDSGLYNPNGIAFDWVTGNVYIIDSKMGFIAVCGTNPTKCATVVQEPIAQGSDLWDITLHPNEGIMFWTNKGREQSIKKAGMDGRNVTTIVSESLGWPRGITVDEANSRIYWVEAQNEIIETTRFDGSDRQHFDVTEYPFGIDIFGDMIFYTDSGDEEIVTIHKFGGRSTRLYYENKNPYGLTVMHTTKQPKLCANPCENSQCTHLCAISGISSQCLCPVGMLTKGNACLGDDKMPKLLVAQQNFLLMARVGTIGRDIFEQIDLPPQIQTITALVYNPINNSVIISDNAMKIIIECKMDAQEYIVLVNDDVINVTRMDIDVIGENLFWFDAGKQTIEVMSLKTGARVVLLSSIKNLDDILFVPDHGALYFSKAHDAGNYAEIFKMHLFPSSAEELIEIFSVQLAPLHLVFDREKNTLAAVYMNKSDIKIKVIVPTGYNLYTWRSPVKALIDAVQIKSEVFLLDVTDSVRIINTLRFDVQNSGLLKTNFHSSSLPTSLSSNKLLAVADRNMDSLQELRSSYQCSPGNPNMKACSHICLPGFNRLSGECRCPANLRLSNDGLNCVRENSQRETTIPDLYEDENYVETYNNHDTSSSTISILKSSMNYSDSSDKSKSNDQNDLTGFLIVFVFVIIILIVVSILGITAFLVITQRKHDRVSRIPKLYVPNSL